MEGTIPTLLESSGDTVCQSFGLDAFFGDLKEPFLKPQKSSLNYTEEWVKRHNFSNNNDGSQDLVPLLMEPERRTSKKKKKSNKDKELAPKKRKSFLETQFSTEDALNQNDCYYLQNNESLHLPENHEFLATSTQPLIQQKPKQDQEKLTKTVPKQQEKERRNTNKFDNWKTSYVEQEKTKTIGADYELNKNMPTSSESNTYPEIKCRWKDIQSLFINDMLVAVEFDNPYTVDWRRYHMDNIQYVVWTKICKDHEEGLRIEMKKEARRCNDCKSKNLKSIARLTVPLDLSQVAIPVDEEYNVYVAINYFDIPDLVEIATFSENGLNDTYAIYQKIEAKTCSKAEVTQYSRWLEDVKKLVERFLKNYGFHLHHGRITRRKIDKPNEGARKRCFIFADIITLKKL